MSYCCIFKECFLAGCSLLIILKVSFWATHIKTANTSHQQIWSNFSSYLYSESSIEWKTLQPQAQNRLLHRNRPLYRLYRYNNNWFKDRFSCLTRTGVILLCSKSQTLVKKYIVLSQNMARSGLLLPRSVVHRVEHWAAKQPHISLRSCCIVLGFNLPSCYNINANVVKLETLYYQVSNTIYAWFVWF